jgi:hypothetical protein
MTPHMQADLLSRETRSSNRLTLARNEPMEVKTAATQRPVSFHAFSLGKLATPVSSI